jgi:hypothetical protein
MSLASSNVFPYPTETRKDVHDMARDEEGSVATEAAPDTTEAEVTEVSAEATESTEAPSEATPENGETPAAPAKPEGPTAEEITAAVETFKATVELQIQARDAQTGELPQTNMDAVKAAYIELPAPKGRKQARDFLEEAMKDALLKTMDSNLARAYLACSEGVKSATGTRETVAKPTVDPIEEYMRKITATYLSTSLVPKPEGLGDDWPTNLQERARNLSNDVQAYVDYLVKLTAWSDADEATRGDEPAAPDVAPEVVEAANIARGRVARRATKAKATGTSAPRATGQGYSGPRRDMQKHIAEVFAAVPSGTFIKTGTIAKTASSEYPNSDASSGAVQARLDSASFAVAGVTPTVQGGVKGAIKA